MRRIPMKNDMGMLSYRKIFFKKLLKVWRSLNGETAYHRYLVHWHNHHREGGGQPLSRKAFFAAETQRKWSGFKRCC